MDSALSINSALFIILQNVSRKLEHFTRGSNAWLFQNPGSSLNLPLFGERGWGKVITHPNLYL